MKRDIVADLEVAIAGPGELHVTDLELNRVFSAAEHRSGHRTGVRSV